MNPKLPEFELGKHYRRTTPAESMRRWKWITTKDVSVPLLFAHPDASFHGPQGWEWARIEGSVLTIHAGYAWNGASPKFHLPFLGLVGIKDCPGNLLATLVHDVLYQFSGTSAYCYDRINTDWTFYAIMLSSGFRWAGAYYKAVQWFGCRYWQRNNGETSKFLAGEEGKEGVDA